VRSISPVILAIVLAGCTETKHELVEDEGKDIPADHFCKVMTSTSSCAEVCGDPFDSCFHQIDIATACTTPVTSGKLRVQCQKWEEREELTLDPFPSKSVDGRRPERLLPPLRVEDASALGSYFATSAHLESAAVLAFEHLIVELEAHGAPPELIADARVAREDEIRHARVVGDLARRFGATPAEARMEPTPVRRLLDIALENEVEGVVRETLGAALATWRATNAGDAAVREAMAAIAEDERAHAELSWRVGAWLDARLSDDERAIVRDARVVAVAELYSAFAGEPAEDVVAIAGVPRAADVRMLVAQLEARLWSAEATLRAA
jgi:hypothetical protein